ncbi:NAD dependent epimerase/dehydratase family protein-like protein [Lojkania enalia]|uniref:NAD dependent epimerase/dehydratase family protein-like protein n=1 Tax=Lojkania enalia TaxID=147567 RepID=A0A9P4JYX8_9PLEO|nr:NAD dependent epimerase/dehydratase family protein-like protein [Didymosphaeria enalia]
MATVALVGSTGLVGSHILSILVPHSSISSIFAYTRRELPSNSPKLNPLSSTDTLTWVSLFPKSPVPNIFFSALGTTKAQAGSVANQRKIDLDLNLDLAKAAREAGVETYVLISTAGANSGSRIPYSQMKGELEDKVKEIGFKHTVILRPGLIGGTRQDSRPTEYVIRALANGLRKVSPGMVDFWSQDADTIARAAVNAGLQASEGIKEEGVWVLSQKEIVQLGKE